MGLLQKLKDDVEKVKTIRATNELKKSETKAELDAQGIAYCPRCLSTSITAQKKGGSIVKGLVGGAILGPIGLLAGGIGRNKIEVICLKCHHKFKA